MRLLMPPHPSNSVINKKSPMIKKPRIARIAKQINQRRKGVTAVEFALTLPILFLLVFGSYELSRANMMRHTIEAACYEGCRVGILPGANAAQCEAGCREILLTAGISDADVQITPADLSNPSELVNITITVDFADNTTIAPFFMSDGNFVRTCELTREIRPVGP